MEGTVPPPPTNALIEEVYGELRRLADAYLRREQAASVQATELVHETYLRLLKDKRPVWKNRTHFLAVAAISMRRLLVERARARHAAKRGGGQMRVTLTDLLAADLAGEAAELDVLDLDRALAALEAVDARQARIVELRFFGGLSVEEVAETLEVSPATVKRDWTVARAWLLREIQRGRVS